MKKVEKHLISLNCKKGKSPTENSNCFERLILTYVKHNGKKFLMKAKLKNLK